MIYWKLIIILHMKQTSKKAVPPKYYKTITFDSFDVERSSFNDFSIGFDAFDAFDAFR